MNMLVVGLLLFKFQYCT